MIDLEELSVSIKNMTRRQEIYRILKRELSKRGYWKSLPRGNPVKGFKQGRLSRGK